MIARLRRLTLFVLYQISLVLGIVLLPLALVTERVGFSLPVDRLIERLGDAYEASTQN